MSNGHNQSNTHGSIADLTELHFVLGHYARQLFDAQKQRIMAGNRVAAMERDGLERFAEPAREIVREYEAIERGIDRVLVKTAKQHFMADWIAEQRGIGLPGFARLLGVTGNIDRFSTVSKLWKYLGLHVVDGHAPKRVKGESWTHTNCGFWHLRTCKPDCRTDHHPNCVPNGIGTAYAPQGRVVCHQLGEAIVQVGRGGPYRAAYDRKRAQYLERERTGMSGCPGGQTHKNKVGKIVACVKPAKDEDGGETSAHINEMAKRYAVKELVKNLWIEWHTRRGQMSVDTQGAAAASSMPPVRELAGVH